MARDAYQRRLLRSSGNVRSRDPLVAFLYLLMRDEVAFGHVADLVNQALVEVQVDPDFTNGWSARYAQHLARRLERRAPKARPRTHEETLTAIHETVLRMRRRAKG